MDMFVQWREALQLAPDVKTVKAVMAGYVDALGPLANTLPAECQGALQGEFDVQAAAVTFLHAELCYEGSEEGRAFLHEVAFTFASAAVRITLLYARPMSRVS